MYSSASFNDPDGDIGDDPCRKSYSIKNPVEATLHAQILCDMRQQNLVGERNKLELKALVSLPEDADGNAAKEQKPHCDDNPEHEIYRNFWPDHVLLSGVRAVMPGTKLWLLPKGKDGPAVEIKLEVGDTVVFRGNCWHYGAKYEQRNLRLHFYFSSPKHRREKGQTYD